MLAAGGEWVAAMVTEIIRKLQSRRPPAHPFWVERSPMFAGIVNACFNSAVSQPLKS
jgi:hypothetical protein